MVKGETYPTHILTGQQGRALRIVSAGAHSGRGRFQERRDCGVDRYQKFDQLSGFLRVVGLVVEADGFTEITDATGTADAVDVLFHVGWKVEVDDVLDTGNIYSDRDRDREKERCNQVIN